jgi:hypothetical protein
LVVAAVVHASTEHKELVVAVVEKEKER